MERRKAERRHLGANRSVQPEEGIRIVSVRRAAEAGVGREGERGEKSMEEVTNILSGV
jgi:hypothetical protein